MLHYLLEYLIDVGWAVELACWCAPVPLIRLSVVGRNDLDGDTLVQRLAFGGAFF
jgi:hypothetical protein